MTAVAITAEFTRSMPDGTSYAVAVAIIDAVGISRNVLVYKQDSKVFSHVASVYDMETYPASSEAALSEGVAFYRDTSAYVTYSDMRDATYFEQVTKDRLKILAVAWNTIAGGYAGTDIITVTG